MSLLQRLKNLWKLSEYRPIDLLVTYSNATDVGTSLTQEDVEKAVQQLATIIDTRKPLDIFPNHPDLDYDETH